MPLRQRVNGPASLRIAVQDGTSFPNVLGLSDRRGVSIRESFLTQDVDTDASGPAPADVQTFGSIAFIRFRLVTFDDDQLFALHTMRITGVKSWTPGQMPPPGTLMGAAGGMFAVRIDSPYGDLPYIFPRCHLMGDEEINLGTERSGHDITMRAIAGVGSNTDPAGLANAQNQCVLYYRPSS